VKDERGGSGRRLGKGNGQEERSLRNEHRFNDFGLSENTAPPRDRNKHPISRKIAMDKIGQR
jgi:hypothetical protein